MEIILLGIIVVIAIIMGIFYAAKFLIGKVLVGIPVKILQQFVEEQGHTEDLVDPEKPIHPSTEKRSSEYIAEIAEQAKADNAPDRIPDDTVAAPPDSPPELVQKVVPTPYEEATRNPVQQQPVADNMQSQAARQPQVTMNPLVENDMPQEPLIDAIAANEPINVTQEDMQDLTDDNVYIPPKSDKLKYGVRDASYSPNRILRDKRYERNSAG